MLAVTWKNWISKYLNSNFRINPKDPTFFRKYLATVHFWKIGISNIWISTLIDKYPGNSSDLFFLESTQLPHISGTRKTIAASLQNRISKYLNPDFWLINIPEIPWIYFFFLGEYPATIYFWNQKNNSCVISKLDFKIYEFQLWLISLKTYYSLEKYITTFNFGNQRNK
jgi:hypothetical protein